MSENKWIAKWIRPGAMRQYAIGLRDDNMIAFSSGVDTDSALKNLDSAKEVNFRKGDEGTLAYLDKHWSFKRVGG